MKFDFVIDESLEVFKKILWFFDILIIFNMILIIEICVVLNLYMINDMILFLELWVMEIVVEIDNSVLLN